MKKKTTKDILLMRILCVRVAVGIIGVAVITPNPVTTINASAKETERFSGEVTIDQLSTNVYDFIKIEDDIYYDPATNIVYMKETTYGWNYIYEAYMAPDGLPYKYDPQAKTFHTVTSEQNNGLKKDKKL